MRSLLLMMMLASAAFADESYRGWCEQGGHVTTTAGIVSTTQVQASYPLCTVTVYPHGSTTPVPSAQVFSDDSGTVLGNPFTADANGYFTFFVANGHYDIKRSGTIPTWTEYDVLFADPSGGSPAVTSVSAGSGISVTGPVTTPTVANTGVTSATAGSGISVSGPSGGVTFTNTGVVSAAAGAGMSVSGATGAVTFTNAWGSVPSAAQLQYLRIQPNAGNNTTIQGAPLPELNVLDYNFSPQTCNGSNVCSPGGSSGATLTGTVGATLTLTPCPLGVAGTHTIAANLPHLLHLAGGTGTAEPVQITGGTCAGDGVNAGTIQFTPANNHSGTWTIGPDTNGGQECVYMAHSGSLNNVDGVCVFPPKTILSFYGPTPNAQGGVLTVPDGISVGLIGGGEDNTVINTVGTTGDWIVYDAIPPGSGGQGGGTVNLGRFTIQDSTHSAHTTGSMVKVKSRGYGDVSRIKALNCHFCYWDEWHTYANWHDLHGQVAHSGGAGFYVNCATGTLTGCQNIGIVGPRIHIANNANGSQCFRFDSPIVGIVAIGNECGSDGNITGNSLAAWLNLQTADTPYFQWVGNIIDGYGVGVEVSTASSGCSANADIQITANHIGSVTGIELQGNQACNVFIKQNTIIGSNLAGQANSDRPIYIHSSPSAVHIEGNSIQGDGDSGVFLSGSMSEIDITNNKIGDQNVNGSFPLQNGIVTSGGTITGLRVKNNARLVGSNLSISHGNSLAGVVDISGNPDIDTVRPTVVSANTLTLSTFSPVVFISGNTVIKTITASGAGIPVWNGKKLTLIFTHATPAGVDATGNVAVAVVPTQNRALSLVYDSASSKWYPLQ